MTQSPTCSNCHSPVTKSVAFCPKCGKAITGAFSQPTAPPLAHQPTVRFDRAVPAHAATQALSPELIRPGLTIGDVLGRKYKIQQAFSLVSSVYYEAVDASGNRFLVHELVSQPTLPQEVVQQIGKLSQQKLPNLHPHLYIEQRGSRRYTVFAHPGEGWQSVNTIAVPLKSQKQAIGWVLQFGQALVGLHGAGYGHWLRGVPGREALILQNNHLQLSNITHCQSRQPDTVAHDSRVLAELLYYLTVGQSLPNNSVALAPRNLQGLLQRGLQGYYTDLKMMLRDLSATEQSSPSTSRALRQLAGSNTHPGRKHAHNEDYIAVLNYNRDQSGQANPLGLYIVADGIGGHDAGDRASRDSVKQAFHSFIQQQLLPDLRDTTQNLKQEESARILRKLIEQANKLIYKQGRETPRRPGTTITCALVAGDQAVIGNVGDSRTYLFRQGQLQQITRDHSLVAMLVEAQQIAPEEIYTHKERNKIYRSLGSKPDVEIDLFNQTVRKGDRLVLCSDGLWEMTRNEGIIQALRQHGSPQAACDTLVDLANQNGGVDNISIIIVNIE